MTIFLPDLEFHDLIMKSWCSEMYFHFFVKELNYVLKLPGVIGVILDFAM